MPEILTDRSRLIFSSLLVVFLTACGGGGSSTPPMVPPPLPPAQSKTISGTVLLGPVSSAAVEISGTSGSLATGSTAADGTFGPIQYSGTYEGPLRITVTGTATSEWTCDYLDGCAFDGQQVAFGDSIVFNGALESVVPNATSGETVVISLLSNFVAKRTDVLGGLTAVNVDAAYADISGMIGTTLEEVLNDQAITLPDYFGSIELFDLEDLPDAGSNDDAVSMLLSLFNSALIGLSNDTLSTGDFITALSDAVAAQPVLPVSRQTLIEPSIESFVTIFQQQLQRCASGVVIASGPVNALLSPGSLDNALDAIDMTLDNLPTLILESDFFTFLVDDAALAAPLIQDFAVTTSTGDSIQPGEYLTSFSSTVDAEWFSVMPVDIDGAAFVRMTIDTAILRVLPNDTFNVEVVTIDSAGAYVSHTFDATIVLDITRPAVDAGFDRNGVERTSLTLQGFVNDPAQVETINWTQVQGTAAVITNADTLEPTVVLPSVESGETITMELTVGFDAGDTVSDLVNIYVSAYTNLVDVQYNDPGLSQCISDLAAANNYSDVGEVVSLVCTGIADVGGLDEFPLLASLTLTGNMLTSLQPLLALTNLSFLDITGNPALACAEVDLLAEFLIEGSELLVDDACIGTRLLDLGADGFDAALDNVRNQIYVSVPDRNEIAVVSLTDLRIVDRLALSGTPNGIDLSIDGTRLFAALNGSNAVAVIDIDQRTVQSIDLGAEPDHPTTYDVVEGQPDRLFVSANPGSGGFAYITQVLLDQGNLVSRVANNRIIRARPVFARSPDQQFVYVGAGFSPNSLYKLSLAGSDAPIALEDDHGSVGGTDNLVLNSAGTRIALGSGQVLRTGSFIEEGQITAGRSVLGGASDTLFVTAFNGEIQAFDFATLAETGMISTGCNAGTSKLIAYDNDESFFLLQAGQVCIYTTLSRSEPADPFAELRFLDLAFEECVIDAAMAAGFTLPEEFMTLDCSANTRTILSIEGIERFTSLLTLDLSNSGVIELTPLQLSSTLQSLTIRNASVTDIAALLQLASLTDADLTGNPGITCDDLDQLTLGGVAVQTDLCTDTVRVELSGIGHDLAFDAAGNRAFVSIPSVNAVSEIDLATGLVSGTFPVSAQPRGIDLGGDGQTLYAALHGSGDIAVVNVADGNTETIDLTIELDDDRTWDIAEVSTDRVVVSTNPGSNGFGYIVEVRRDLGNAATRVASNRIIRAAPVFEVRQDQTAVYVGEGFSPNSVYKLDATQASLPIVAEDDHGAVSGSSNLALSPDGTRLYLRSGQVLDSDTLDQVGQFPAGLSLVSQDGQTLFVGDAETDQARVYDIVSGAQVGSRRWGCDVLDVVRMAEYGDGILVLGNDLVCFSQTVPFQ